MSDYPTANEFGLKRVPMFGRVNLITSDVFVVYMDGCRREAIPVRHGFPVSAEACDELIEMLKAHRSTLGDLDGEPFAEAICEAQDRTASGYTRKNKEGRPGHVYCLMNSLGYYKIGKSINPEMRISQLEREYGDTLSVCNIIPCTDMDWAELYLHEMLQEFRVGGEWFALPSHIPTWLSTITSLTRTSIGIGAPCAVRQ